MPRDDGRRVPGRHRPSVRKTRSHQFRIPRPGRLSNGIIGGYLPNFPSFREGVALGPFLEAKFGIPVYINNDGDLFAYGEALGGALPEVNARLEALGSPKKYKTSSATPSARDSAWAL